VSLSSTTKPHSKIQINAHCRHFDEAVTYFPSIENAYSFLFGLPTRRN
jgi:hypothetical protein